MNDLAKNKLINRIHRIEGQARGVEAMIREDRLIQEIVPQLKAISSASDEIILELANELLTKKTLSEKDKEFIIRLMRN